MLTLKINPKRISRKKIEIASKFLKDGKLVAFPTETVYGLGASVLNRNAIERIYDVKGRGKRKPLTIHIASKEDVNLFAKEIPPIANKLISLCWPGPLTIILPKREEVPEEISPTEKVGLRMPSHPISLSLIGRSGPVVAPSANLSGHLSPTNSKMVIEQLGDKIDCLIDGGRTPLGIESTVIDITAKPVILREGMITKEEIEKAIDEEVEVRGARDEIFFPAKVIVVEGENDREVAEVMKEIIKARGGAGLIATREVFRLLPKGIRKKSWGSRSDVRVIAGRFFSVLDSMKNLNVLVVENLPPVGIGRVLREKLLLLADEVVKIN